MTWPAKWTDPALPGERFLDFTRKPADNQGVFRELGVRLLKAPGDFGVCDEFGGPELLIPEFREALLEFLREDRPVLGVFKAPQAAEAVSRRITLGKDYLSAWQQIYALLSEDKNTRLLETTGRYDEKARSAVLSWVKENVRR